MQYILVSLYYFVAGGEELSSLCIDSCFIPPSGAFTFVDLMGVPFFPEVSWEEGGRCWPIKTPYVCGDANGDSQVNVGDAVFLITYVFKGGPAPDPACAGDSNGDSQVNVGDAVYLISYIFKGGPPPVAGCCP